MSLLNWRSEILTKCLYKLNYELKSRLPKGKRRKSSPSMTCWGALKLCFNKQFPTANVTLLLLFTQSYYVEKTILFVMHFLSHAFFLVCKFNGLWYPPYWLSKIVLTISLWLTYFKLISPFCFLPLLLLLKFQVEFWIYSYLYSLVAFWLWKNETVCRDWKLNATSETVWSTN